MPNNTIEQFNLTTAAVCGASGNRRLRSARPGTQSVGGGAVGADAAAEPLRRRRRLQYQRLFRQSRRRPIKTRLRRAAPGSHDSRTSCTFNGTASPIIAADHDRHPVDVSILNGQPTPWPSLRRSAGLVPSAQLTWQISPTLLNIARVGWVRDTSQTNATPPQQSRGHSEYSRHADLRRTRRAPDRQRRQQLHRFAHRYGHPARPLPGQLEPGLAVAGRHDQGLGQAPDPIRRRR